MPATLVVLMLVSASACCVTGVQMLAGTAWALIALAAILFVVAILAMRGMSRG